VLYLWREKPFLKVKIRVNSNTYFEDKDTYYVEFDLKVLEILNSELINYQELFVPVVGKWAKQVYVKNESIDTFSIQEYTDVTAHVLKVEDNFSPDEKETYDYLRGLF
jgi:hypothetical protein